MRFAVMLRPARASAASTTMWGTTAQLGSPRLTPRTTATPW